MARLEKEKDDLETRVAKTDSRIKKFKKGSQKFTKHEGEKFTKGFCLA